MSEQSSIFYLRYCIDRYSILYRQIHLYLHLNIDVSIYLSVYTYTHTHTYMFFKVH